MDQQLPDDSHLAHCQLCRGEGTYMRVEQGNGIVRRACPSCLGSGRRFAVPAADQKAVLMFQGVVDGTVEAFCVNGMMVVPSEEGVAYVTRQDAMRFFGLFQAPSDALVRIGELEEVNRINERLLENRDRLLRSIPGCGAHGDACVPHAMEWVERAKARGGVDTAARLRLCREYLDTGRASSARELLDDLILEMEYDGV